MMSDACADPEGQTGGPYTHLVTEHSMLGHYRHASETPVKWEVLGEC